jgi:hypothetical protein
MKKYPIQIACLVLLGVSLGASPTFASSSCEKSLTVSNVELDATPDNTCFPKDSHYASPEGFGVLIPEPGATASLSVLRVSGALPIDEVILHRDLSGHLAVKQGRVFHGSQTAKSEMGSAAQIGSSANALSSVLGCANSADYSYLFSSWTSGYKWWYRSTGSPSTAAQARIQAGIQAMSAGLNRCGTTILNNSSMSYMGGSSYTLTNDSNGGCLGGGDITHSEAGWGVLPNLTLATTCTIGVGISIDADIMFNTAYSWFTGASTTGCSGAVYDLQGIATHEGGHAFGLAHVQPSTYQVMKPQSGFCETSQRQLGLGDATGMHALY